MDYSENFSYSSSTADKDGASATKSNGFDLLSFVHAALQPNVKQGKTWNTFVFFSIHLGPWNTFRPKSVFMGASFSVTLVSPKFLVRHTLLDLNKNVDLDELRLFPRLLAIKTPRIEPNSKSSHAAKLLLSLAKEHQILQNPRLAKHENIITAFGCIWQTLSLGHSGPVPALVLEGADLGDLADFSDLRDLTVHERLKLSLDIASGLHELHAHGVIHGDLKPNNILVFKAQAGPGYTAKLADFGSAILRSGTTFPCLPPAGTVIYRAPECGVESTRMGWADLIKVDLFSLGVTLAFLLVGSHIVDNIKAMPESKLQALKEENGLAAWIIAHRDDIPAHNGVSTQSDDWVTDPSWIESSIFADYDVTCWFLLICNHLLAADACRRPDSVEMPATALRFMLRQHLLTLSPCNKKSDFWSRISALATINRARLRKMTGEPIPSTRRISNFEIDTIAHCCKGPGSYLKEAKLILKHNGVNVVELKRRRNVCHAKRSSTKLRSHRDLIPRALGGLANKMAQCVERS